MVDENDVALESEDVITASPTSDRQPRRIPIDLRKTRTNLTPGTTLSRRILWRLKHDSQFLRSTVQLTFLLLCVWIGCEFYFFIHGGKTGGLPIVVDRPPGVEGLLPISALISLKYWIQSGIINGIHPSGLFILIAILLISILLKKAFCSWLCPVGTLSESLWMIGKRLFGRNVRLPSWLDYPLRWVKYLLLGFFLFVIASMDVGSLQVFIESPYNRMADAKMYFFFAHITSFALWMIVVLCALSVVVKNFWCRYLCPYGGLLGLLSLLSPLKVIRNASNCIDCELCTKACASGIKVHAAKWVRSDECTACYQCIEACPVKHTLEFRVSSDSRPIPAWVFGTLVVSVFLAVTGLAMLTGNWQNNVSHDEYMKRLQELHTPSYNHFGGGGE